MPVEFIGHLFTSESSEIRGSDPGGPVIDQRFLRRIVRAHEDADFDRALVALLTSMPDPTQVAAAAAASSERLGFLVAHRPGFVAPTVAARLFATLDHFSAGRVALHAISGASDADQHRDGDFLDKPGRYERSREFLQIVKQAWTAEERFDYDGRYYRVEGYAAQVRPFRQPRIPIYFGGSSDIAYEVGGAEADVYALHALPLEETAREIERVRAAAAAAGRIDPPRISVSFRPILGPTEALAWERAEAIRDTMLSRIARGAGVQGANQGVAGEAPVIEQLQRRAAERGPRHDRALWTGLAAQPGAQGTGNKAALVGTPETVAQALLDYVDLGVSTLLIRGFDPYQDTIDFGRELIPLVRAEVARRDRERVAAGLPVIGASETAPAGWRSPEPILELQER